MTLPFVLTNLKSRYCLAVFLASLFVGYFLTPKDLEGLLPVVTAGIFILTFALTMSCLARLVKEKVRAARVYKSSAAGIVGSILGITALSVCGVGTPVCGMSAGMGILSLVLPGTALGALHQYSIVVLVLSVVFQLYSLHKMGCLKKHKL